MLAADGAQGPECAGVAVVRRRREQYDVRGARGQRRDGLVPVAVPGEAVCFVHDDGVPRAGGDRGQHVGALDVVHRDDRDWPGGPRVDTVRERGDAPGDRSKIDDVGLEAEAFRQLAGPLFAQAGRRDDQHAVGRAARPQLRDRQAGLNRLPQPHLVRQQDAAAVSPHERDGGFELVRHQLDAGAPRGAQVPRGVLA